MHVTTRNTNDYIFVQKSFSIFFYIKFLTPAKNVLLHINTDLIDFQI